MSASTESEISRTRSVPLRCVAEVMRAFQPCRRHTCIISSESVATMTSVRSGDERTPSYTRAIKGFPAIWRSIFRGSRVDSSLAGMTAITFMPSVSIFCLRVAIARLPKELRSMLRAIADGNQENCALAFGVRREKADYVVVVKSEAGRTQTLCIRCQIQLTAEDASFELHRTISAVAKALQNRMQVCQKENVYGGIGGQLLFQS